MTRSVLLCSHTVGWQLPDPPEPTPAEAAQPEAMDVDSNATATAIATTAAAAKPVKPAVPLLLPETEVYLATLAVTACLRLKRLDLATSLVTALVGTCCRLSSG